METTVRLYAPGYTEKRTYWLAVLFAVGNRIAATVSFGSARKA